MLRTFHMLISSNFYYRPLYQFCSAHFLPVFPRGGAPTVLHWQMVQMELAKK